MHKPWIGDTNISIQIKLPKLSVPDAVPTSTTPTALPPQLLDFADSTPVPAAPLDSGPSHDIVVVTMQWMIRQSLVQQDELTAAASPAPHSAVDAGRNVIGALAGKINHSLRMAKQRVTDNLSKACQLLNEQTTCTG